MLLLALVERMLHWLQTILVRHNHVTFPRQLTTAAS